MTDPKLQRYMNETVAAFTQAQNQIADAMLRMKQQLSGGPEAQQIQLLALRRYLRIGGRRRGSRLALEQGAARPAPREYCPNERRGGEGDR